VTLTWPTGGRGLEDGDTVEMCFKTEVTNFGDRIVSDCATVKVGKSVYEVQSSASAEDTNAGTTQTTVESVPSGYDTIRFDASFSCTGVDDGHDTSDGLGSCGDAHLRVYLDGTLIHRADIERDNNCSVCAGSLGTVEADISGLSGDLVLDIDDGTGSIGPP
jgi:hypothetical protein